MGEVEGDTFDAAALEGIVCCWRFIGLGLCNEFFEGAFKLLTGSIILQGL